MKDERYLTEQLEKEMAPWFPVELISQILLILEKTRGYSGKDTPCVVAIDGRAASGKTTLAGELQRLFKVDVIHMDDFFVPWELRSKERYQVPGENVHYERFIEEVLPFISKPEPFSYRIFDCSKKDYNGCREIKGKEIRIVEGSYSCHPKLGSYADITVFLDISPEEQLERIRRRNGEEKLKMFQERWIPMEEAYFSYYHVKDHADIVIDPTATMQA